MRRVASGGWERWWGRLIASGATMALMAGAAGAVDGKFSVFNGKVTYKTYCASCHGTAGKGDGSIASALKQTPTDLTQLATKAGGEYPAERVEKSIDGREAVAAHGSREMPVWGDAFLWPEDNPNKEADAKRKIGELVEFLRSLQSAAKN